MTHQDTQGADDDWTHVHRLAARLGGRFVLNSAATQGEPAAYLHTLHMEGGQTYERLASHDDNMFGEPGRDYSDSYTVTIEPLYRHPPAPSDGSK